MVTSSTSAVTSSSPVGDVEDGVPPAAHPAKQGVQLGNLVQPQRGCRLVEDDELRIRRHGLGDLDQLLLRDRQARGDRVGVERDVKFGQHLAGAAAHGLPVDQAEGAARPAAEKDIFGDRQAGNDRKLLKHRRDTERARACRTVKRDRFAAQADLARIRAIDAGQQPDQRRLAATVFAQKARGCARPSGRSIRGRSPARPDRPCWRR